MGSELEENQIAPSKSDMTSTIKCHVSKLLAMYDRNEKSKSDEDEPHLLFQKNDKEEHRIQVMA